MSATPPKRTPGPACSGYRTPATMEKFSASARPDPRGLPFQEAKTVGPNTAHGNLPRSRVQLLPIGGGSQVPGQQTFPKLAR